jgi:membrane-associated protein
MDFFDFIIKFISQPDVVLGEIINNYGNWVYAFLFIIIFAETGLIILTFLMPFLPGDALIFAIGMIAANNQINFSVIIPLLMIAAILGDNVNYFVGKRFGNYILNNDSKFFIKEKHIIKAKEFFERNGKQSIIIARFVPVVRTIVPFLCGTTGVPYRTFLLYSLFGAFMWVGLIGTIGYFLGTFEFVKTHLGKFIIGIIVLANIPLIKQLLFSRKKN